MKIAGYENVGLPVSRIILPREGDTPDISMRVQAMPIGVDELVEELFPSPRPAIKYAMNAKGGVLRDQAGNPIQTEDRGAEFQKAEAKASRYQMLYYIWRGLSGGGDVEFDAEPEGDKPDKAFMDKIQAELQAAGLTQGDFKRLVDGVLAASNFDPKEIDSAKADFFDQTGSGST